MRARSDENGPSRGVPLARLLIGSTAILCFLALIALFMNRVTDHADQATQHSFQTVTHASTPVIDVMAVGDSAIAVTNFNGWTDEQVRIYLSVLREARARDALASVGIPPPSATTGYDKGMVFLIDGHPPSDILDQFARKQSPGYAMIASAVRGTYQWPPDRLTVGPLDEPPHE